MIENVFNVGSREYIADVSDYPDDLENYLTSQWRVFSISRDGARFLLADGRAPDEQTAMWLAAIVAKDDAADPL